MKTKNLNYWQKQYIDDCLFLEAMGYPNDLFDSLWKEKIKDLKKNK